MSPQVVKLGSGLVCALAAAVALPMPVQSAGQATFRTASNLVAVYATVRDARGALVRGLTRDDFELRENGDVREIAAFSNDLQPITLAMILDRSGSLAARINDVSSAASGFFDALRPGDRVSLSSLSRDCLPLTNDIGRLRQVVSREMPPDMGSPIWDSIDRAFFSMTNEGGRRAILIFSDGSDTGLPLFGLPGMYQGVCTSTRAGTGASFREVAERAARNGVLVYAVGVPSPTGQRADGNLRSLARDTGGELYRMRDDESLTPVFVRIAEELHHQYLLGFVPAAAGGSIDVRVKRSGHEVRARRRFAVGSMPKDAATTVTPMAPLTDGEVEAPSRTGMRADRFVPRVWRLSASTTVTSR